MTLPSSSTCVPKIYISLACKWDPFAVLMYMLLTTIYRLGVARDVKNGCFSASVGLIRLSGFKARHCSSKSTKRLRSFISASFIPVEAASRRVRRSRVGLTTGKVRTAV